MSDEEIAAIVERLRQQGSDDGRVEVKAASGGLPKSLWQSVSAFANSRGGVVILGLSEADNFTPAEGFEAQKILDAVEAGLGTSAGQQPQVEPVPRYDVDICTVDGAAVVLLEIASLDPQLDAKGPCFETRKSISAGSYKRVADKDKHLSAYEIHELQQKWTRRGIDHQPVPGTAIDDLNPEIIQSTFRSLERSRSRALDGVEDLRSRLRRIKAVTSDGTPTLAGYLTFGFFPQEEFPQLTIDVAVHPAREKGSSTALRFLDRHVCDGPIPYAVGDAVARVLANLRTMRVVSGVGADDVPEIPEEVLREAITNAVMHRDYSEYVTGRQVAVDIFPDRVEITNPGGLWGDRTELNLGDGQSASRNEVLSQLLRVTPRGEGEGPIAENQGSGIPRMRFQMLQNGLPVPVYEATLDSVKVTLQRHGLLSPETRDWLGSIPGADRTKEENLVLALIRHSDAITVDGIRQVLDIDSDRARSILGTLQGDGLITGLGDGPYELAELSPEHRHARRQLSPAEQEIVDVLDTSTSKSIREISAELEKPVNSLRPLLRTLSEEGVIVPTAPPTSKLRAYLLPAEPDG
ncbi:ATP-binding protein [Brevibacterium luteolum]|uniref:AAA family ATPase n=1 Tax=Brevibacterium luteolum TaxID=199591 RepID=A0A6G8KZG9_9MICO|nr:ATP-binding protein [Brevibacterium luteolum]MBU8578968.1 putative DNA binding domain-containing protein [Brevibacterium luteolum]QIN29900.1 AAA family ATPase [Brevibacterium luteolum]